MLSLNKRGAFVSGVSAAKQILSAVVLLLVLTIDVVATPWHLGLACEYVTICKEEQPNTLPDFMEMVRLVNLLEHELRYMAQHNSYEFTISCNTGYSEHCQMQQEQSSTLCR